MEMAGVCSVANNNAVAVESKSKEAVRNVQREFLSQVSQGVGSKDAFFNSLKAMNDNYKLDKDTLELSKNQNVCMKESAHFSVKPSDVKPWLELISFAIPIIKQIIDLFGSFTHKEQEK